VYQIQLVHLTAFSNYRQGDEFNASTSEHETTL